MDFGVGYRWRPHESNLLLAVGAILFGMAAGGGIVFARETYGSAGACRPGTA